MNKPVVSVICTNYNKGEWIKEAIESFLSQKTSFVYEILLIDDASTDGSAEYIKKYAKKYPEKIRAFYNKKNLGITKTWIKVCEQAKGKYIARCDGDDYWIDERKLQKQVGLLEKNAESKWCSTDYDIIAPNGRLIQEAAYKNGKTTLPVSYSDIISTKGFLIPSSWLIESSLLTQINNEISPTAVDDTFNIQLELFIRTKLTHLPEATVAYRGNEGSDSRPVDMQGIVERNQKLLTTQKEYINKYKNVEYKAIIEKLLEQSMLYELLAVDRLQLIHRLWKEADQHKAKIDILERKLSGVLGSKRYRAGSMLARPLSFVRKLTRKKND